MYMDPISSHLGVCAIYSEITVEFRDDAVTYMIRLELLSLEMSFDPSSWIQATQSSLDWSTFRTFQGQAADPP